MSDKGPNFRQTLEWSCWLEGDALVVYSKLPRYGLCATAPVPAEGRYRDRVRISIAAVGVANASIPVAFGTVDQGRDPPVVREVRDVPPGQPTVIEWEADLAHRQAFVVNLLTTWDIHGFKKPIEEYTGPGFRIDCGDRRPGRPVPPASYDKLFAGVPLKARSTAKTEAAGRKPPPLGNRRIPEHWSSDLLVPASADPRADAERLIQAFLPRAFRRPVSEEVLNRFVARVHAKLDAGYPFLDAMTYGYKLILSSPHFLLMLEARTKDGTDPRLDDYAVAARLAYFLWSGPPDEELLAAAAKGELTKPETLRSQTERLLNHPKARWFTEKFTGQWLDLRKIDATIPDPQFYGEFDHLLLWAMPRGTHLFSEELLKHYRSLLEFVHSDWSVLYERLAAHYGIPGVSGNDFRKVTVPPGSHRGGVMTQAGVLKVTSDGTRTSPVLRGKWVLERILGQPPAQPPPDVPAVEPDIRGATGIRQQLDKHRSIAACASCHVHIDPLGFALEALDPIGGYREFYRATAGDRKKTVPVTFHTSLPVYRGPDVGTGGRTHDGRGFADVDGYKKPLLANPHQLARSLTEKLIVYATGAEVQFAGREVVEAIVARLREKNHGFRSLVHAVVQSRVFLNK